MLSESTLLTQKQSYLVRTNGGISLPMAGALYWLALGLAGFYLKPGLWNLLAFFTSGLIFPVGLLLQRPMKANILLKSPLSGLLLPAIMTMLLSWPIIIATSLADKTVVPLTLAIGMSLHWPTIGWLYGSRTCLLHAPVRAALVSICWFSLPEARYTVLPFVVAGVYLASVWGLKREVALARQRILMEEINSDN